MKHINSYLFPEVTESKVLSTVDLGGGANSIEIKDIVGFEGKGISIVQKSKTGNSSNTIVIPKEYIQNLISALHKLSK